MLFAFFALFSEFLVFLVSKGAWYHQATPAVRQNSKKGGNKAKEAPVQASAAFRKLPHAIPNYLMQQRFANRLLQAPSASKSGKMHVLTEIDKTNPKTHNPS